eukprot:304839_1
MSSKDHVLSLQIYTKPYPQTQAAKQCVSNWCNCISDTMVELCILFAMTIPLCVLGGSIYAAILIFDIASSTHTNADTFTIHGQCILSEIHPWEVKCSYMMGSSTNHINTCVDGWRFDFHWKIYNFTECSESGKSNDTFSQTYNYRRDGEVGQIVACYSTPSCDEVYLSKVEVGDVARGNASGLYSGGVVAISIGIFCCGCIGWCIYYDFRSKESECFGKYTIRCKCSYNICRYITGKDKKEYRYNRWNEKMTINERYDYFISYYLRKYNLTISEGLFQILYRFGNDGDEIDCRDKYAKWCLSKIIQQTKPTDLFPQLEAVYIHYIGWDAKYDEWIFIKDDILCECNGKCKNLKHRIAKAKTQSKFLSEI